MDLSFLKDPQTLRNLGIVMSQAGAATSGNPLAGLSTAVANYGIQQNVKDMYNKQAQVQAGGAVAPGASVSAPTVPAAPAAPAVSTNSSKLDFTSPADQAKFALHPTVKGWTVGPDGKYSFTFYPPDPTAPPQPTSQPPVAGTKASPGTPGAVPQATKAQPSALAGGAPMISPEVANLLSSLMAGGGSGQVPFQQALPRW